MREPSEHRPGTATTMHFYEAALPRLVADGVYEGLGTFLENHHALPLRGFSVSHLKQGFQIKFVHHLLHKVRSILRYVVLYTLTRNGVAITASAVQKWLPAATRNETASEYVHST